MRLELTDDQRAMVESVRRLRQYKFRARVHKWQDGTFPYENIKDLAELGVLGMAVPEEFGGLDLPVLDCVLVLEEIAKTCYVTAMAVMSAMGAQNRIIANYAPKDVQQKFLPGVVTGDVILAICMTEPHAGTDVANYKTKTPRRVHLIGDGTAGIPALHAAALEPELFASVTLRRTLEAWSPLVGQSVPAGQLTSTVHGALTTYDLPDLVRSLDPAILRIERGE